MRTVKTFCDVCHREIVAPLRLFKLSGIKEEELENATRTRNINLDVCNLCALPLVDASSVPVPRDEVIQ